MTDQTAITDNGSNPRFLGRMWLAWCDVFWAGLWPLGLGLLLLYPVRQLSGDRWAIVRVTNYLLPWLPALLIPAAVVAGLKRRKWLAAALIAPTLMIGLTFAPLFYPPSHDPFYSQSHDPVEGLGLKIMSHNLHSHRDVEAIAGVIQQQRPDIVLLQEFSRPISPTLMGELADLYPGNRVYIDVVHQFRDSERPAGFSQAVLSRYPIRQIGAEYDKGRVQKVVVETPAGPVTVWNVHFIPPFMYPNRFHDEHAAALTADIAAVDGPLIVGGDFNVTDQSASYRLVRRHLRNAHWEVGQGLGFSFPAPPFTMGNQPIVTGPIIRIDHIFYSHHFAARDAGTLTTSAGSDHLPVVAELSLRADPPAVSSAPTSTRMVMGD